VIASFARVPVAALGRIPVARLVRTRRSWLAAGAWTTLAVVLAVEARAGVASHPADRVLIDAYGAVILPLLAYTLVGATLGAPSMARSNAGVVAFGAPAVRAALATVTVAAIACASVGALLAAASALIAHGTGDPPPLRDAIVSAYAGGLGGAAYASWFSLGASIGRRGGGRVVFLVTDWLFGASDGALSLATPRAHLRNLFGGAPPMDASERSSAIALVVLALVCALGCALLSRRHAHR
jgi:hypothetical protein